MRKTTVTVADIAIEVKIPSFSRCQTMLAAVQGLDAAGQTDMLAAIEAAAREFLPQLPDDEEAVDFLLDLGLNLTQVIEFFSACMALVTSRMGVVAEASDLAKN